MTLLSKKYRSLLFLVVLLLSLLVSPKAEKFKTDHNEEIQQTSYDPSNGFDHQEPDSSNVYSVKYPNLHTLEHGEYMQMMDSMMQGSRELEEAHADSLQHYPEHHTNYVSHYPSATDLSPHQSDKFLGHHQKLIWLAAKHERKLKEFKEHLRHMMAVVRMAQILNELKGKKKSAMERIIMHVGNRPRDLLNMSK